LIILFIFWSIPVSTISAFASLDRLSRIEGFGWLLSLLKRSSFLSSAVQGFLPSMALSCFLVLLPFLLKIILTVKGYLLNSQYDRALLRAHHMFLVLNVFFFTAISGPFLHVISEISEVAEQPIELIDILAVAVPQGAVKLTNYMIFEGFVGYSCFWLLRLDDLLICKVNQWLFCKTRIEKQEAENPPPFDYPIQYARELFIFCVALVYSTMTPIILPFATCYFLFAFLSGKLKMSPLSISGFSGAQRLYFSKTQFHLRVSTTIQRQKDYSTGDQSSLLCSAHLSADNVRYSSA